MKAEFIEANSSRIFESRKHKMLREFEKTIKRAYPNDQEFDEQMEDGVFPYQWAEFNGMREDHKKGFGFDSMAIRTYVRVDSLKPRLTEAQ